ncbi:hypothetical protein BZA77DRAFT_124210 [Pyronema omphalodes]|nr:hypothetical protein BZA77DRAFT_124210 [Pyronema omphalodes]
MSVVTISYNSTFTFTFTLLPYISCSTLLQQKKNSLKSTIHNLENRTYYPCHMVTTSLRKPGTLASLILYLIHWGLYYVRHE